MCVSLSVSWQDLVRWRCSLDARRSTILFVGAISLQLVEASFILWMYISLSLYVCLSPSLSQNLQASFFCQSSTGFFGWYIALTKWLQKSSCWGNVPSKETGKKIDKRRLWISRERMSWSATAFFKINLCERKPVANAILLRQNIVKRYQCKIDKRLDGLHGELETRDKCDTMYRTASHCITLHHNFSHIPTVTHYHTATHCNTLLHCNTLELN